MADQSKAQALMVECKAPVLRGGMMVTMGVILEAAKETPVIADVDVVVVGGGP